MTRGGMTSLVRRLRQMTEAGTADYSVGQVSYWTDTQLVEFLDDTRVRLVEIELIQEPEFISGDYEYKRFSFPRAIKTVEGTADGTDYFRIYDSTGATISSGWTFRDRELSVTFTADQEGSARYWSGYTYDLQATAREVWMSKAAHVASSAINFSADGASFNREGQYAHCLEMAKMYGYSSGNAFKSKTAQMKRYDLNASGDAEHF